MPACLLSHGADGKGYAIRFNLKVLDLWREWRYNGVQHFKHKHKHHHYNEI